MAKKKRKSALERVEEELSINPPDAGLDKTEAPVEEPITRFNQEELELAYRQMQQERRKEGDDAVKAAEWIKKELGVGTVQINDPHRNTGGWSSPISPYKVGYVIVCIHETYGPYLDDWTMKLDNVEWAKKHDEWVYGYAPKTPFYEVQTPFGVYKLTFEYFDNHCTGY